MQQLQNTGSTRSHKTTSDLSEFRKASGVSRKDLCSATGIPYRTLQKWECGERCPSSWVIGLVKDKIKELADEQSNS